MLAIVAVACLAIGFLAGVGAVVTLIAMKLGGWQWPVTHASAPKRRS